MRVGGTGNCGISQPYSIGIGQVENPGQNDGLNYLRVTISQNNDSEKGLPREPPLLAPVVGCMERRVELAE